ncbi:hypothetical protein D081_0557 [Anaerovibrio sp. JC8]|uniref:TadE/TadG family type IV pilus assembly protein n=1 Tax=Anaerovibrio sp. JC8 TaxID=1240085 RepID=UPI000A0DB482|nr:TadE/TadG family type IV pilus assembly protein [Anaerovibrio sp. JC8]ORU01109.1 hypothetical protein D081_0557 [Anaerovibrio sp. JC8]
MMKEQRGAVMILFAVLIPFLMCFAGLVIDLGNLYIHYSRLQNTADAAALAGGSAFAESGGELEKANEFAQKYVTVNDNKASFKTPPKVQEKNGNFYYVVVLKERVPLYFLRYFPQIGDDTEISAAGVAQISLRRTASGSSGGGGYALFDNLFTAIAFNSVNNIQNPDNYNIQQDKNNVSTFDGPIVVGDRNEYDNAAGKIFLDPSAFGPNGTDRPTVNEAIAQGQVNYPEYNGTLDVTDYYRDTVQSMMNDSSTYRVTDQNQQNAELSKFYDDIVRTEQRNVDVIYFNIPNLNLNISQAISGDTNKPLYVICDNINNFSFSGDMTSGRPIVLINNGNREFWMNCQGGTFTGDIYAPFGSVYVNDNHTNFYGSIVAGNRIQLQSQGYYFQKNYTGRASGPSVGYVVSLVSATDIL